MQNAYLYIFHKLKCSCGTYEYGRPERFQLIGYTYMYTRLKLRVISLLAHNLDAQKTNQTKTTQPNLACSTSTHLQHTSLFIPRLMEREEMKATGDDWWPFKKRANYYNADRVDNIYASHVLVYDENMSAYTPWQVIYVHHVFIGINTNIMFIIFMHATEGLSHLSFSARKPKPLGTEFQNLVDGVTGSMQWLEIPEGKERMKPKQF